MANDESTAMQADDGLADESLRIVALDEAGERALLIGSYSPMSLMLWFVVPLVAGLLFAGQLAFDITPWPLGSYELTLLAWMGLWGLYLVYSLWTGAYVNTYVLDPRQRRLWHLNSGELLDLVALAERGRQRVPGTLTDVSEQERLLPLSAERLLEFDWQGLRQLPPYRPAPLPHYLRHFWDADAYWGVGVTLGICLLVPLFVMESLSAVLLAILALALGWLASALAGYVLQRRAPSGARALLDGCSIEDVVRHEA
jgi:hypothetical protein